MWLRALLRRATRARSSLFQIIERQPVGFWVVFIVGAVITALITFPNHYNFRTYGYDLGYIAQIVHLISRGQMAYYVSSGDFLGVYIEPHYSLSHLWCVPLYLLFGTWGLLISQWLGVLWAGVGVYLYAFLHLRRDSLAALSMAQFFGMWGVLGLLSFDVHEFTIVALPWVFYFLERRKTALALLSWFVFVTTKENYALWSMWMLPLLAILYREAEQRKILLKFGITSLLWIGLSWGFTHWLRHSAAVPPNTISRVEGLYGHWAIDPGSTLQTQGAGSTLYRVILRFLREPDLIVKVLFEESPQCPKIKQELYIATLASGGWSLILQPIFLLILVPVYFYKFAAADCQIWGILHHYNMEFATILPIAVVWAVRKRSLWVQVSLLGAAVLGAWGTHLYANNRPYSHWVRPAEQRWYTCQHYQSSLDYKKIHEGLAKIPKEASLSTVSVLMPHIPPRKLYYHFPARLDTVEYIVMLRNNTAPWPISREEDIFWIDSLSRSPAWEKIHDQNRLIIFQRKK